MANCFSLFATALLSFAALILAIVACAGSTKNYDPINKIYAAQIDISNIKLSTVLPAVSSSTSLDQLGLPSYFNIGLWSYCLADSSKTVTSCTSPSGIQKFNLKELLYDNVENNKVNELIDSIADIALPDQLQDKMSYYNNLVKCMFITLIIGIVLTFVNLVINIFRWFFHFAIVTWLGRLFSLLGFLSLAISAGTSTGTYVYIRNILKDNSSEYGISLSLGRVFYGILWGSVLGCLLNLLMWALVRNRRYARVVPIEEKPLV